MAGLHGPRGVEDVRRHPALQDLSRDHFTALGQVLEVRRAATGDRFAKEPAAVRAGFLALVREVLPEHFREEEELLAPLLRGPERAGHHDRLLREHGELRAAFAALGEGSPLAALWAAAQALQAHVRWEEDELFERLQRWLGEEGLAALGARSRAFRERAGMPVGPGGTGASCPAPPQPRDDAEPR